MLLKISTKVIFWRATGHGHISRFSTSVLQKYQDVMLVISTTRLDNVSCLKRIQDAQQNSYSIRHLLVTVTTL